MINIGSLPMMREKEWRERYLTHLLKANYEKKILDGYLPLQVTGKGEVLEEMPEYLQFREMPEV